MVQVLLVGDAAYPEPGNQVLLDGGMLDGTIGNASGGAAVTGVEPEPVTAATEGVARVRQRDFDGYDSDGNPVFGWVEIVTAKAVWKQVRMEIDSFTAGQVATVTVLYDGVIQVTESAVVVDWLERAWDVVKVKQAMGTLELTVRRVDPT